MDDGRRRRRNVRMPMTNIGLGKNRHPRKLYSSSVVPYSHIQILQRQELINDTPSIAEELVPSVRRGSLQEELQASSLPSSTTNYTHPTSFAQAVAQAVAMSDGRDGKNSRHANAKTARETVAGDGLEPLVPFKFILKSTKKKTKKWSPLDLGAPYTGSEPPSSTFVYEEVLTVEPAPGASNSSTVSPVAFPPQTATEDSLENPTDKGKDRSSNPKNDSNSTPTQSTFNVASLEIPYVKPAHEVERSLIHQEDSDSVKDKLEDIMARIDDVFDVEEWDPDLPPTGLNNSPEHLTAIAQPVAYTTVGSLVKSNAAPQFTAPVRIQREGASRRPPPAPVQSRSYDNHYGFRGPNSQFSMGYAPPVSSPRRSQHIPRHQSTSSHATLSDAEKETLLRSLGVSPPSVRSGNVLAAPRGPGPRVDPFYDGRKAEAFGSVNLPSDHNTHQAMSTSSSKYALDKMQTLLGLSQYPNPMQQFAKDRLSEFSAIKVDSTSEAITASVTQRSNYSIGPSYTESSEGAMARGEAEHVTQMAESPHYSYRFPPPGLQHPSKPNPLLTANDHRLGYPSGSSVAQLQTEQQRHIHSGRPYPLTAGPPGQRQNASGINIHAMTSFRNLQSTGTQLPVAHPAINPARNSPWPAYDRQNMFTSLPVNGSDIKDTLSPSEAAKYYPGGLPPDMTGKYTRLSSTKHEENIGIISRPTQADEKKKQKEQDDWWYSGIRRFNKTAGDHVHDLEKRDYERTHGQEPQAPPSPVSISAYPTITVEEIKEMSEAECAAPLLDGLFGTLLEYADRVVTPGNKSIMSNFTTSPAWCIDDSEKGNQSFFGEDWGPPPKRLGRDPRYQPFME